MSALKVGVLASGTGSLLQAILDARDASYEVCVVVSDRPGAGALDRAVRADVPAIVCDFASFGSREEFTGAVVRALTNHGAELVASAGFMRLLSPGYFEAYGGRTLNSHPALLPSFPGARGVRDALAHGVKVSGATIHFMTLDTDSGPIIVQEAVPVRDGDTEETLHERIKEVERRLYPEAIRLWAQGRLKVEGQRVHVLPSS